NQPARHERRCGGIACSRTARRPHAIVAYGSSQLHRRQRHQLFGAAGDRNNSVDARRQPVAHAGPDQGHLTTHGHPIDELLQLRGRRRDAQRACGGVGSGIPAAPHGNFPRLARPWAGALRQRPTGTVPLGLLGLLGSYTANINIPQNTLTAAVQVAWGPETSINDLSMQLIAPNGAARSVVNTLNLPVLTGRRERDVVRNPMPGTW